MPPPPADTIFRHPAIRPLAYDIFAVEALAVRQGSVVAMGTFDELRSLVGPATEVVSLLGAVVQPAFHDAHVHLLRPWPEPGEGLADVRSALDLVSALSSQAMAAAEDPAWVAVGGLDGAVAREVLGNDPLLLDRTFPGVPFLLLTSDGHGGWLSGAACKRLRPELAAAGMSVGGSARFASLRKDSGRAAHVVGPALETVLDMVPGGRAGVDCKRLARRTSALLTAGVTTAHEAQIEERHLDTVERFFADHPIEVTGRMHGMLLARQESWEWLKEQRPRFGMHGGRLSLGAVKAFADGSLASGTAWMDPGQSPPAMEPAELKELAVFCLEEGFQLAVHAVGRQAVASTLDVMREVRPRVPVPYQSQLPAWRIEHAIMMNAAEIQRAAHLGVVLSVQPMHLTGSAPLLRSEHPEHLGSAFPWTDFTDGGVALALGSDAPVAPVAPLVNLSIACGPARREMLGIGEAPLVLHALSRDVALHAHTVGGAMASLSKLGSGTLLSGEPADLVVLDTDPLTVPLGALREVRVLETWVGGCRVERP